MTVPSAIQAREFDQKGAGRIGLGAGLGFVGAIVTIVVPVIFLFVAADFPGGFFTISPTLVEVTSLLVLTGAILLLLSLFFYRRSFSALRKVDPRFYVASVLCILGSLGFLLLLVAAGIVAGNTGSLLTCVQGHPSHALSCLESGQPFGAVTAILGFLLGWLGGVGIMIGLFVAGDRFRSGSLTAGGIFYGLLLIVLILPLAALFVTIPYVSYLLLLSPIFALLAPALALSGASATRQRLASAR
ncbi:MAG TPA: hypothetical protein VMC82_03115 [Thermoplasmata archaeon]|nr:hypothetical protein [Thermoplasmata archaeon]